MEAGKAMMRLLVIGGTYFLGKAFVELCDNGENEILLVNRGNRALSLQGGSRVKSFLADRHDARRLQELADLLQKAPVDAVIDFCAYEAGDVRGIMEILPKGVKQYVFVSTCDIYRHGSTLPLDESAALEDRSFGGQEGAYIAGKVRLERELRECSSTLGIAYTVIRPTIIYGPGNYAPREGIFFHWIQKAGQILIPEEGDGTFQMVYVKDVAKVIRACLLREECFDQAINVCGDEVLNYQRFADYLEKACDGKIDRITIPVAEIATRGIPLPFPLTEAESERYVGDKVRRLGVPFTLMEDGLRETYRWFLGNEALE